MRTNKENMAEAIQQAQNGIIRIAKAMNTDSRLEQWELIEHAEVDLNLALKYLNEVG